jgi:hypothetical protein
MPELTSRDLDRDILGFIGKYSQIEASEVVFQSLALKVFSHQYQHNKIYRQVCDLSGTHPKHIRSWKHIPAMPAQAFKEFALISFPARNKKRIFRTSGTTNNARGEHAFDTLKLYEAAILPSFQKYLLPDDRKLQYCFLIQDSTEAPDLSLSHMMSVVNKTYAKNKGHFYIGKDWANFGLLVRDLRYAQIPVMLLATAFSLKGFLDYLINENIWINMPEGSRLMETGGFKGRTRSIAKEELYALCADRLGIQRTHCVSEYGMTELSSQAYDTTLLNWYLKRRAKPHKKGPAWMRTLVIDPRTGREVAAGKKGVLRHFDLANRGSVLAIQTEDIGVQVADGFEVLSRAKRADLRGCSLVYEKFITNS